MRSTLENRRLAQRHLYYIKMGWSMYLWYILDFIASVSIIYFVLIGANLVSYVIVIVLGVIIGSDIVGWLHFHKMGTYAAEQDIAVESSPYTMKYLTYVLLPFMKIVYELGKVSGFDLADKLGETMKLCEKIIKDSEKRWQKAVKKTS